MTEIIAKSLLATLSATVCWLLLSYLFFPIKLAAPPEIYFAETVSHLVPLKGAITSASILRKCYLYSYKIKEKSQWSNKHI